MLGALAIAARHRGIHLSPAQLRRDHQLGPVEPSPKKLLDIARASGLRAVATELKFDDLMRLGPALPAILLLKNGSPMVLLHSERHAEPPHVVLQDPDAGEDAPLTLDEHRLALGWAGEIILIKRDYRLRDQDQAFGLGLIISQLLRDHRIARDIAVAAIVLSVLALGPIIFWRLLIDRVLYYQSFDTLAVLCTAMLVLILFETAFGYMRRFLVIHVTARIDAKLSTYMFDKVLSLPLDFFERSSTGVITRDMNEMFKIRSFLTGQLFGTVLDSFVLLVFLPIMFFFSAILTAVVLGFSAVICLWIVWMLPVLGRKCAAVFRAEGAKNAFLVESLQGIRTVKSLALDARQRHEWDVRVAAATRLRVDELRTANIIQTVVTPLERVLVSGTLALAVYLAIAAHDQIYIGAIVAFMMLTQRIASPLIQLSHLLQQYDEARIAVRTIAALVNQPAEEGRSRVRIRTPLKGRIEFEDVRFCYRGAAKPALDGVSFTVPEGTILGVMGRSGSGKTTVARLLQMLDSNYEGLIKIDGNDLREIDHLPRGYETYIQEGSTNLSGGQRQRLAIARALLGDPRILILDEATSSLDAESEAIVNANLLRIAKGRTLVVISHRLSMLVPADAVLVLDRGRVYDIGRHDELLERCDIYRGLWHRQNPHLQPRPIHGLASLRAGTAA